MDGLLTNLAHAARSLATGAPAGRIPRPPATPLYNWLADSLPMLLIVAGAVVVITVIRARAAAAKQPKELTLEERFARLKPTGVPQVPAQQLEPAPRAQPRPKPASPDTSALDAVIRDTDELAERLAAAMDARAERLEGLIRDADDRIRRLELARTRLAPEPSFAHQSQPTQAARLPQSHPGSLDSGADPVHSQVFALADQGLSALEIARRLGQPTGQVELILALRGH